MEQYIFTVLSYSQGLCAWELQISEFVAVLTLKFYDGLCINETTYSPTYNIIGISQDYKQNKMNSKCAIRNQEHLPCPNSPVIRPRKMLELESPLLKHPLGSPIFKQQKANASFNQVGRLGKLGSLNRNKKSVMNFLKEKEMRVQV